MTQQSDFSTPNSLHELGWKPYFQQQLTLDDYEQGIIARVITQHRDLYQLATETGELTLAVTSKLPSLAVGDWIVLNQEHLFSRLLERQSLFRRKAAGSKVAEQLIAANLDTAFIVCSLNEDFNLNRIERYLAVAKEAEVEPVVLLTKADLCADPDPLRAQVQALDPLLMVEVVNALDDNAFSRLLPWCGKGRTIAFLGSSGVGKSTLVNALTEQSAQATGDVSHHLSKGRHTTTARSMHRLTAGGLVIDTPGMREFQVVDIAEGLSDLFADVEQTASRCRFSDCTHNNEPGCAINAAVKQGELDQRRVNNYAKLQDEQAHNRQSLAEQRAMSRQLGKHYRSVQDEKRKRRLAN